LENVRVLPALVLTVPELDAEPVTMILPIVVASPRFGKGSR